MLLTITKKKKKEEEEDGRRRKNPQNNIQTNFQFLSFHFSRKKKVKYH